MGNITTIILKQNQDSYELTEQNKRKNTKLLPSKCKPRDQINKCSQNASKREQIEKKNRFCIKETNLITIAKKKNTKTKGLFYFNKNYQFLKKIVIALVALPMSYSKKKV